MEFILPDSVMNILSRLETDGFSAFVAGGAVRDTIMGKRGVGTLLVVGPERDMGGSYVVFLSDLYTFPSWKTYVIP